MDHPRTVSATGIDARKGRDSPLARLGAQHESPTPEGVARSYSTGSTGSGWSADGLDGRVPTRSADGRMLRSGSGVSCRKPVEWAGIRTHARWHRRQVV